MIYGINVLVDGRYFRENVVKTTNSTRDVTSSINLGVFPSNYPMLW